MDRIAAIGDDEFGLDGPFCGGVCGLGDAGADVCDVAGDIGGFNDDWIRGSGHGAADDSGNRLFQRK